MSRYSQLRPITHNDLHQMLRIEMESFAHPWNERDFHVALRQRNVHGVCVGDDRTVYGYMIYATQRRRNYLMNIAVSPGHRRLGIGTDLVGRAIQRLSPMRDCVAVDVGEDNLAAHLFFARIGFLATGVLPQFYCDSNQDAYHMEYYSDDGMRVLTRVMAGDCRSGEL